MLNSNNKGKSSNMIKNVKVGADSDDETHPTLKRRYARLFITVPKKASYGYKLKYMQDICSNGDDDGESDNMLYTSHSNPNLSKLEEEWLPKSKNIEKENYFKIFSKYSQLKSVNLTNIYDPPLTMKEIKKVRREKRKQYKIKHSKTKNNNRKN